MISVSLTINSFCLIAAKGDVGSSFNLSLVYNDAEKTWKPAIIIDFEYFYNHSIEQDSRSLVEVILSYSSLQRPISINACRCFYIFSIFGSVLAINKNLFLYFYLLITQLGLNKSCKSYKIFF